MRRITIGPRQASGFVSGGMRVMLILALATALCTAGCAPDREPTNPEPPARELQDSQEPQGIVDVDGDTTQVLMLGRSVMRGWFDHWGDDGSGEIERNGYALRYGEVASPPDIASSAAEYIAQAPEGTVVFFKLCFVDFEAYSRDDVTARSNENLGYAEEVAKAAADRGFVLVLGNALPRVRAETTGELTDLHGAYNDGLERLAADHDDVYVFDLYGALTDDGALSAEYAASPDDSHLNDAAYSLLDDRFFAQLDRITGR